jgi:Hemerythrin HHE cation binding domain
VTDMAELIRADHARISKVIEQLDGALAEPWPAAGGREAGPMWETLAGFLRLHVAAAEEIAYRALAGAGPGTAAALAQAAAANADLREALAEARLSPAGSLTWRLAVQAACRAAQAHIASVEPGPLAGYQRGTAPAARRATGRQWVFFMTARVLDGYGR